MTKSSTVTIGKKPASALWADLLAANTCRPRPPYEDGWRTIRELADETEISRASIERMVEKEFAAGRLERVQANVGGGNNQRAWFYRPKVRA